MSLMQNQRNLGGNQRIRNGTMSKEDAESNWSNMRDSIKRIYDQQASNLSYEELYRTGYNLVLNKYGDLLYNGVKQATVEQLKPFKSVLEQCPEDQLLKEFSNTWERCKMCIDMIKDILMYMDRNYVPKQKLPTVEHMQTSQFKNHVILTETIKQRFIQKVLSEIWLERDGNIVDRTLLRKNISMLVEVGISSKKLYEQEFEQPFIQQTREFYRNLSNSLISKLTCPEFLAIAQKRLEGELDLQKYCLDYSTEKVLVQTFLQEFIENHAETLLTRESSGLIFMIKYERYDDIRMMYDLFKKVPASFELLKTNLQNYIINEGDKLIQDEGMKNEELVAKLIDLKVKTSNLLSKCFKDDQQLEISLRGAFESFINKSNRTAMSLVAYLDDQFKKNFRTMNDVDIEEVIDKVIQIFRFLTDKDIFEGFYKYSLAKRLLDNKMTNTDAEKLVIAKLKEECGFMFTSKLEVMFKDMNVSEQNMLTFQQSPISRDLGCELSVQVLTHGNWPTEKVGKEKNAPAVNLPPQIDNCVKQFNQFYLNKHQGRILYWRPQLGHADLRYTPNQATRHELTMSTYQMVIALCFNQKDQFTFRELLQKTQIPETDFKCNLIPFFGLKVIKKSPDNKEFNSEDVLSLNLAFKSQHFKIKMPVAHLKENKKQSEIATVEKVDEDRKHVIEATVVKIMKTRRSLEHQKLIEETIRILSAKFQPQPMQIKQRIESLIERDYLERDPVNRHIYRYLA